MLDHDDPPLRIQAAEILAENDSDLARERWEFVLSEEKAILEKGMEFSDYRVNEARTVLEVPLVEFQCNARTSLGAGMKSLFTGETHAYVLGLTDEFLHIVPILIGGGKGNYYKVPPDMVKGIERRGEDFDIHFEPTEPEMPVLEFTTKSISDSRKVKRITALKRLTEALKRGGLKKSEIAAKYFDATNLERP